MLSKMSGYKVKWDKSEALPLNVYCLKSHIIALPFKWSPEGMHYLGMNLKSNPQTLFNLKNLLNDIKEFSCGCPSHFP